MSFDAPRACIRISQILRDPRRAYARLTHDAVSVELGELQLVQFVPYRAPPMLELTCATVRDASYGRVAELTSRSAESFIRAGGNGSMTQLVNDEIVP